MIFVTHKLQLYRAFQIRCQNHKFIEISCASKRDKMSVVNQGDKSEPVVNVTVNNNTSLGTKCNSSLISICNEPDNRRPLSQVKLVSTTTAALVQGYLTLNDMASVTRSSDKNLRAPNQGRI